MKLGTVLTIDDFTFPLLPKDSLDFNMDRTIAKIDIPGTYPDYQDMGPGEKTLNFSGSLIGDTALDLSTKIETKMWSGQELQLSYGDIQKRVRIKTYTPKIRRSDRVDYSIQLIVCFPESQLNAVTTTQQTTSSSSTTPTLAQTMDKTYTIKSGDTLWDIAARQDVYGDGTKWEIIAKANGITDEYNLQIGQVIKIPSASNAGASVTAYNNANNTALGATGQAELTAIAGSAA